MLYLWKHDNVPMEDGFVKSLSPTRYGKIPVGMLRKSEGKNGYLPFTAFSLMTMASCRP